MAIWKLTIEDDEGQKTVVPLVRDEYSIGRRDGHTIRLTERNVSRDHARLRKNGDGYLLEDLGSYNGVFVNGHRVVEPQRLQNGDLVLIGDYRIEAHNEDAAARPFPIAAPAAKPISVPPPTVASRPTRESKPHRLVLLTGDDGGKEFPLDKPAMTIGRGEEVDIRVNHSSVSRTHCELHTIDQDQFEVVDAGSANGIRVNGQDVKKALLSPGDTLELGDVVLKYVAAGQAFVFDAAAAAAAREAGARKGERKSSAVVWGVLLASVAAAVVVGVLLARNGGSNDSGGVTASTGTAADDPLAMPYQLKKDGNVAGAHEAVAKFSKDSPSRKDKRFLEIENAWADKAFESLKAEPSVDKKRAILEAILESGADESRRTTAADMLGDLDKVPEPVAPKPTATVLDTAPAPVPTDAPVPTTKPTPTVTAPPPTPTATTKPTATATTTKPTATATTPVPATGTPGVCPSWKGDYSAAMRAKDYECVRTMLMPRLNAGAISQPEARYLKAACAALGDTACQKRAAEKL